MDLDLKIIQISWHPGSKWFRVFGRGAVAQDRRIYPAFFSERTGHRKWIRLGENWVFRFLAKNNY